MSVSNRIPEGNVLILNRKLSGPDLVRFQSDSLRKCIDSGQEALCLASGPFLMGFLGEVCWSEQLPLIEGIDYFFFKEMY